MTVLAIDPSLQGTGWALFRAGRVHAVGLARAHKTYTPTTIGQLALELTTQIPADFVDTVVCEIPQIYPQNKGDPNDLIAIAILAGALLRQTSATTYITCLPHQWKGSVPKYIHNKRVCAKLLPREMALLSDHEASTRLKHNIIDAIGIGLWYLRR